MRNQITVSVNVQRPLELVWEAYTDPHHVVKWNHASDDWYSPHATNELKEDGRFVYTMAAKDGSTQFDFSGTYTEIQPHKLIRYVLDDERVVEVHFNKVNEIIVVEVIFEAEESHTIEEQQEGWQAILNNFADYTQNLNPEID